MRWKKGILYLLVCTTAITAALLAVGFHHIYFDRPLATFTVYDADKAALLAGIAKSPRHYAPSAKETGRILRRRDQKLGLMARNGFISRDKMREADLVNRDRGRFHVGHTGPHPATRTSEGPGSLRPG